MNVASLDGPGVRSAIPASPGGRGLQAPLPRGPSNISSARWGKLLVQVGPNESIERGHAGLAKSIRAAAITSTAWSYGLGSSPCLNGFNDAASTLIGVSQVGNTVVFASFTGFARLRASLTNRASRAATSGIGGDVFSPTFGSIDAITSATVSSRGLANASCATRSTRARISS